MGDWAELEPNYRINILERTEQKPYDLGFCRLGIFVGYQTLNQWSAIH